MDTVDASVAVKRTTSKVNTMQTADQRPAAEAASQAYSKILGLPPATSGTRLKVALMLSESSMLGARFYQLYSTWQPGVAKMMQVLRAEGYPDEPRPSSLHSDSWGSPAFEEEVCDAADAHARLDAALHSIQRGGHMAGSTKCSTASNARPTVLDYHFAFTHGMVTPTVVAERVIKFLETHNPKNHWLSAWSAEDIRQAAAAATERYAAGKPLSVLDGVPFVVKDCIDALPYETSYGTRFMGGMHSVKADAPCVAAIRELGAVLLGKGAMNELGVFAHGYNTHAGATLNPHNFTKGAGGSSGGPAAAVAAGLCPFAIGTDGGGSIRIPASLCGVVGLKPTQGRLADDQASHGAYTSLITSGPIANSVADLTLLYAVMANINYEDVGTTKPGPPALCLPGVAAAAAAAAATPLPSLSLPKVLLELPEESEHSLEQVALVELKPLTGLKVGVFPQWFSDCTPGVAEVVKGALNRLIQLGATQVDITVPELELVQVGHLATWANEMCANAEIRGWLNDWSLRGQLNMDTRMFFAMTRNFDDKDYLQAQRMRARMVSHFKRAFDKCDIIITPATPVAAQDIHPDANTTGVYDSAGTMQMVRFTQAANFTGLPALVMPAGRQLSGFLPVGVQFMGKPFGEGTLLRVAAALEAQMLEDGMPKPVPSLLINPMECEKGAHPLAKEMTKKLWSKKYGKTASS